MTLQTSNTKTDRLRFFLRRKHHTLKMTAVIRELTKAVDEQKQDIIDYSGIDAEALDNLMAAWSVGVVNRRDRDYDEDPDGTLTFMEGTLYGFYRGQQEAINESKSGYPWRGTTNQRLTAHLEWQFRVMDAEYKDYPSYFNKGAVDGYRAWLASIPEITAAY